MSSKISSRCCSNNNNDNQLDDCGCCESARKLTPVKIENPPGLSALNYRVGTHSQFKASMITALQEYTALQNLTTREDDDFSIAMLDAWATIGDILTFYQERVANEGFIKTATERRSILELARSIGYELRPGVAANAFLAFTVDGTAVPEGTIINIGTKVQSLPGEGQTPQIFETTEEIEAHSEWNDLRPRSTEAQSITQDTTRFYFKGTNTLVKPGDLLLIVNGRGSNAQPLSFGNITHVQENTENKITIVDVIAERINILEVPSSIVEEVVEVNAMQDFATEPIDLNTLPAEIDIDEIDVSEITQLTSKMWTKSDLGTFEARYNIPLNRFFHMINELGPEIISARKAGEIYVYAFRIRSGVFGNTAPQFDSLPPGAAKDSYALDTGGEIEIIDDHQRVVGGTDVSARPAIDEDDNFVILDNNFTSILPSTVDKDNSWVVLKRGNVKKPYRVTGTREETVSKFLVTGKATILEIEATNITAEDRLHFKIRGTTAFVKSEPLELAQVPVNTPIGGNGDDKSITFDHTLEHELKVGQLVSITGEIIDSKGISKKITKSEIATISEIQQDGIYTKLTMKDKLENRYKRDTTILNANVARATHGETKEQVLGGGDPSQRQQEFSLKETPLTYISASTATGAKSTLEVRVDGILWKETPSLYGLRPKDRVYMVRLEDNGEMKVTFGDGITGRRPPSGFENIKSKYRVGSGTEGILKEGELSLLMSRPLGVRSVTNPVATGGADNPELLEDARQNAPLTVLTMDRIVSLDDVEHFALAFAGIGKAQAIWIWDGEQKVVRLTVASSTQNVVDSNLSQHLADAINTFKDPLMSVKIKSFTKRLFNIEANIGVSKERKSDDVFSAIKETLKRKFSFESRQFNQRVTLSEVVAAIQGVQGVVGVDLNSLYIYSEEPSRYHDTIPEEIEIASDKYSNTIPRAWLLILNPDGIVLTEMKLLSL